MNETETACPFCAAQREARVAAESGSVVALTDGYPVTEGHMLVIPKRHVADPRGGVRGVIPSRQKYR
jgi:hypothetical protein